MIHCGTEDGGGAGGSTGRAVGRDDDGEAVVVELAIVGPAVATAAEDDVKTGSSIEEAEAEGEALYGMALTEARA